jgi:2-octaprenylphenol hydroxylase
MMKVDVVVIGGGIVGLTAALAMAARDYSVAIIEAGSLTPSTMPDSRVYAINHSSKELLQQLGVWVLLDPARCAPYQRMHVWDAATSASIDFDAQSIASPDLGAILEESVIKKALLDKIATTLHITCFPSQRVSNVKDVDHGICITSGEHTWTAQLLLIADGGQSPTRTLLNIPITTWPYHQHAVVASVSTEKAHNHTAYQVFNEEGPLAFLPLVDPHHCSIVWSTTPARAKQLTTIDESSFNQELKEAFANTLGEVHLQSPRHSFPLIMRHIKQYVGKNWMVLGDAAHTIHPLAGLGLNLGLADVSAWMACMEQGGPRNFTLKMLRSYQRQRKYEVWKLIVLMGGLKTLFANPLPPIAALRGMGINVCNHLTPLKRLFIEHAAGKSIQIDSILIKDVV